MSHDGFDDFRHSMRRLAAGVSIITCGHQGNRFGMTITSMISVSFDPPSILVSLNKKSSVLQPILAESPFCVNILSASHRDVSHAFSGATPGADRFATGTWAIDAQGTPYLVDAEANIFCTLHDVLDGFTHQVLIGRVARSRHGHAVNPLVYCNGAYGLG
ncbi:flavin reductase family protein [Gluconacetobacter takamatsuzukensis]|uniref:Flavin reductase family protein n=1 Tax=Gluconacetobacter takamatsuzukensis TaxID=1286190 RepID=A0A7W4PP94_9PROT|nr:flavin reductase family protein [Gluconacetobacter takamatsuzukensis]MBB2205402.1 flavin reductase family protein [Gluconacetobacter takamatsuzukensis]